MTGPAESRDRASLAATVEALAGAVDAHDRRLRKVESTAVRRSAAAPRRGTAPRRHRPVAGSRRPLDPDPTTAAAALGEWVDWLREHYQLTSRIPADWAHEQALVAELAALRAAWRAAYTHQTEPSFELVHFHDALDRVLVRIAAWCAASDAPSGHHRIAAEHLSRRQGSKACASWLWRSPGQQSWSAS